MKLKANKTILVCLLMSAYLVRAGEVAPPTKQQAEALQPPIDSGLRFVENPKPPEKDKEKPKPPEPPKTDIFSEAPTMGPQFATGFNPHMMGDLFGVFVRRNITLVATQTTTVTTIDIETKEVTTTTTTTPVTITRTILAPAAALGAFKVGENASPKPQDRVFFTYHHYGALQGGTGPFVAVQGFTQGDRAQTITEVVTTAPALPSASLNRQTAGFEKTFLDGAASFELRVPCLQTQSTFQGFEANHVGHLTMIGKYAFLSDDAGNVLSGGLALTVPTGPAFETIDGNIRSTLFQPWFGYIRTFDRFFVQGFHSIVYPTDTRDVTLLFNDVGVNYWLLPAEPDRLLSFLVTSFECHVTTPLNHRDGAGPVMVPDLVVLTSGLHVGLFNRTTLSLGVAAPVTGPRPFNIEGFVQLNLRY